MTLGIFSKKSHFVSTVVVVCTVCASHGPKLQAQSGSAQACYLPVDPKRFVLLSVEYVDQDQNPDRVLDELVCVATRDATATLGPMAVRSVFHLAGEDADIRERLLGIILSPTTSANAHRTATRLFVYVADAKGQATLTERFQHLWMSLPVSELPSALGTKLGHLMSALVELGDARVAKLLRHTASSLNDHSPFAAFLRSQARRIELHGNVALLLKELESPTTTVGRVWLARHVMRQGGDLEQLRGAVRGLLRSPESNASERRERIELLRECNALGILTAEGQNEFSEIDVVRLSTDSESNDIGSPSWATLPSRKRAEFYGYEFKPIAIAPRAVFPKTIDEKH